jgi:hypothetical protein
MSLSTRSLSAVPAGTLIALLASAVLGVGVGVAVERPARTAPVVSAAGGHSAQPSPAPTAVHVVPQPVAQDIKATFVAATTDSVTVEGVGIVDGTPDVVVLNLQVSVRRGTSGAALDAANAVVRKLLATLREHGVARADLQTTGLSLYANYTYHEGDPPTVDSYQAGQSVTAKLRKAKTRGKAISAATAVSPGEVLVNGLTLDLEQNSALLTKAQRAAFAAAKKKAREYAELSGRSLGRVMTVREATTPMASDPPTYFPGGGAAMASAGSDVPIAVGSQQVGVSVTVTWALR